MHRALALALLLPAVAARAAAQPPRALLPIDFERSAEAGWLAKRVHAARTLDDASDPATWRFTGTGRLSARAEPRLGDARVLRVDMDVTPGVAAPTRNGLPAVNLRRAFANEDWRAYNRLSVWLRADAAGFPTVPLQLVLHNDGAEKVPDRYGREGVHYVTLASGGWQQVVWEIEPLARDRVTALELGYWANKMLAAPGDRVAFEIGRVELQRVDPDQHTGWGVGPGKIAFSHTGYLAGHAKSALATGLAAADFQLVRVDGRALGEVVLRRPVERVRTRLGDFQRLDFSDVRAPGRYVLQSGEVRTRPFHIGADAWEATVWKALNFF